MDEDKSLNIFALSDYSLIHIFKYVSASDLYNLGKTCRRFEGLVVEKKLWYKIDARDAPYDHEKILYCIDRINEKTTDFLTCSDERDIQIIPDDFFSSDACSKLTILALENQMVRGDLAKLSQYPKTLVELSLRKSFVNNHSAFFKLSYMQMENLKVLVLDECGWVETYMIVQISKYPKLEVLSMYKCKKLSDNDIAYLSMAGCFGFKALRTMDVRFTGLGDQILKAFYKHPTLQDLYFQSYVSTFTLDSSQRHFDIAHGGAMKPHAYLSEYDDIPDRKLETMRNYFGNHCYRTCRRQNLTNHGTVMYKFVTPAVENDYEVDSVLYTSPYGECTCAFGDKHNANSTNRIDSIEKSTYDWEDILKLKNIINEEKVKIHTPYVYVLAPKLHMNPFKNKIDVSFYDQASESKKHIDWINVREPQNLFEIAMYEHTDIHTLQSEIILPTDTLTLGDPRRNNNNRNSRSDDSDDEDQEDRGGRKLSVAGRVLALDDGDVIVEEVYEIARNEEYRRYDRDYQRSIIRNQRENQRNSNGSSENERNTGSARTASLKFKKIGESSSTSTSKDHTYSRNNDCGNQESDSKEKIAVNDSTRWASGSSKEESASENVSEGDKTDPNINDNDSIDTGSDTRINSSQDNTIGDTENISNNVSPNKSNKCNICGNVGTTSDDKICKGCKEKNAEPLNLSTSTGKTLFDGFKKKSDSHKKVRSVSESDFLAALPSTSRDSPSTSGIYKRKRDSSTNTPKIRKINKFRRLSHSDDPEVLRQGLNITYEVSNPQDPNAHFSARIYGEAPIRPEFGAVHGERIQVNQPNNAFYIRIKMPETNRVEHDLINVPMGGGMINILLDVDTKTKVAIKKLSLRGFPKITDCTLEYLTSLKLELLDITKTGISKAAVQHFIKQNPTCRVIHESACTCLPNMHF